MWRGHCLGRFAQVSPFSFLWAVLREDFQTPYSRSPTKPLKRKSPHRETRKRHWDPKGPRPLTGGASAVRESSSVKDVDSSDRAGSPACPFFIPPTGGSTLLLFPLSLQNSHFSSYIHRGYFDFGDLVWGYLCRVTAQNHEISYFADFYGTSSVIFEGTVGGVEGEHADGLEWGEPLLFDGVQYGGLNADQGSMG